MVKISKSSVNLDFIRNISISVQISDNLDFGQTYWKILIEVKILEISRIWPKFTKIFENLNFGEDFRNISILFKLSENFSFGQNFRFLSILWNFRKISNYVKLSKNSDFGQYFKKIANLV